MSHREPSPINPLPPVVMLLVLAIVVAEGVFSLGARGLAGGPEAVGWRSQAIHKFDLIHVHLDLRQIERLRQSFGQIKQSRVVKFRGILVQHP